MQSIRYPNSYQVNYAYDLLGLTTVTQGAKVLAAYQDRNSLGQARAVTYANGIQTNLDLNPDNGQMKKLTVTGGQTTASGGVLLNLSYTHDPLGNVTAVTDGTPLASGHLSPLNEVYSYDNANRLISAVGINGNLSYQYDALGNITGKEGVTYSYDDPNHPYAPTSGTSGFKATYDANGNMVTKTDAFGNQLVLDYDEENQLTQVIKNGSYTEDYTYDATGYRVKRSANGVLTDYVYWGNTLLYETTAGKAIDYVWAEGKLIAKVESSGTTYFHHDHLGSSKLQTDDAGKVISTDVSKPFGPRSCDEVIKDDFTTLVQVNTLKSKITFDEANGKILAPVKGVAQDNLLANHSPVTTTSLDYFQVKALRFRLTAADKDRTAKVVFAYQGKARVRIIGEDNVEYLTKEYTTRTERTQSFSYSMSAAPNQLYLVTLELAANPTGGVLEARNTEYETTWGSMASLGELWTLPVVLQEDARSVRLSWSGVGVSFMVSTDNAKTWESVENGKATLLRNPGRNLVLKAMLQMATTTVLDSYALEVNPANYSLFTGKVLSEETGLVYFGARWYDPEVGRFITVDPAEDGENWYAYCDGDPVNYVDPDGRFRSAAQAGWLLAGPLYFVWDTLKGVAGLTEILVPYPYLPMPVNVTIVSVRIASAVVKNPAVVLDYAQQLGYGLISDIVDTVKGFPRVVLGRPTDEEVRKYGKSLTGTVLTVITAVKAAQSIKSVTNVGAVNRAGNVASKIEANAARQLAKMEGTTPNAHFFSRHGAGTTLEQQYTRATTGVTPDGVSGRPVDSSRFLSNQAQLNAAQRAQTIFQQTGKTSFSFDMGEMIGEGYLRGGGDLIRSTNVQAVFRNGKLYTMFPLLKPLL